MPDSPVKAHGNDFSYLTDLYHGEFPKVLVQLPMYNEDAHCDLIIHRCCKIKWPSHRILIQVRALASQHRGSGQCPCQHQRSICRNRAVQVMQEWLGDPRALVRLCTDSCPAQERIQQRICMRL
jgi:hypothetical protein